MKKGNLNSRFVCLISMITLSACAAGDLKGAGQVAPEMSKSSKLINELSKAGFISLLWDYRKGKNCEPFEVTIIGDGEIIAIGVKTDFDVQDASGNWVRKFSNSLTSDGAELELRNIDCAIDIGLQERTPGTP